MLVLGFDVGRKKTGVAIGNLITRRASPLTVACGDQKKQLAVIAKTIGEWKPADLVVGVPRHLDGKAHGMTKTARHFAKLLRQQFNLTPHLVDERLTTDAAKRTDAKNDDSVAAAVILQDWLDGETQKKFPPSRE